MYDDTRPKFLGLDEYDFQWLITRSLILWQIAFCSFLVLHS